MVRDSLPRWASVRSTSNLVLTMATTAGLSVTAHEYALDDAGRALADLKAGRFDGAAVLVP